MYIQLTVKNEALTHPTFIAALRKALVLAKLQTPAAPLVQAAAPTTEIEFKRSRPR